MSGPLVSKCPCMRMLGVKGTPETKTVQQRSRASDASSTTKIWEDIPPVQVSGMRDWNFNLRAKWEARRIRICGWEENLTVA